MPRMGNYPDQLARVVPLYQVVQLDLPPSSYSCDITAAYWPSGLDSLFCRNPYTIICLLFIFLIKKTHYLFIFRQGGGRKREREKHQCVVASLQALLLGTWPPAQACVLTGNQTGDPLVHRLALHPLSRTRQGGKIYLFIYLLYFYTIQLSLG